MKKMKFEIEIKDWTLYIQHDIEIDIDYVDGKGAFHGDVEINGKTITGEHAANDYLSECGFIIVCNENN